MKKQNREIVTQKKLDAFKAFLERCKRNGIDPLSRFPRVTIGEKDGEPVFVIKDPNRHAN